MITHPSMSVINASKTQWILSIVLLLLSVLTSFIIYNDIENIPLIALTIALSILLGAVVFHWSKLSTFYSFSLFLFSGTTVFLSFLVLMNLFRIQQF